MEVYSKNTLWLERQSVFFCTSLSNQNKIELCSIKWLSNPLFLIIPLFFSLTKLRANTVFAEDPRLEGAASI